MHLITATEDFPALSMIRGKRYLMNDVTAAVVLANEVGTAEKGDFFASSLSNRFETRVLVIRMGAFGDLLLMRPALEALRLTGRKVSVSCLAQYQDALEGLDVEWVPYPLAEEEVWKWDVIINLENVVEKGEEVHDVDMAALWAKRLGVHPKTLAIPYTVPSWRLYWASSLFPAPESGVRIGVQMRSSAACRTWPVEERLAPAVRLMLKKGWQVLLLDTPGSSVIDWEHPNLVPVMQDKRVQTFAETAAILATCDGFVGPDSALTHLAGALGIPGIALYGPFPGALRVNHAKSLKVIEGKAPCAPCFFHVTPMSGPFPKGMPCAKARACVALLEITPERVVHQLEQWMKKGKR